MSLPDLVQRTMARAPVLHEDERPRRLRRIGFPLQSPAVLPLPYVRLDSPERPAAGASTRTAWPFPPRVPEWVVTCNDPTYACLRTPDGTEMMWSDPFAPLQWMADHAAASRSPEVRWVGYISYDLGRLFETIPTRAA